MMRERRLIWYLFVPFLLVGIVSLLIISVYFSYSLKKIYIESTFANLLVRARLLDDQFSSMIASESETALDSICKTTGRKISTRVTLILPSGKVIGDSDEEPSKMDNHADRPEVIEALKGEIGSSIRYSFTLREDMMYVAVPLRDENQIAAVVRVSLPLVSIREVLGAIYWKITLGGILAALFLALISYLISRRIRRPINELRKGAERFARGEFDQKLYLSDYYETRVLAESMNNMAAQLDERIKAIVRQREETDAILSSMREGVIAMDLEMRVLTMNRAAAAIFDMSGIEVDGLTIQEIARNIHVHRFAERILESEVGIEEEIPFGGKEEIILQARGAILRDEKGRKIGGLLVLNDITNILRLENIRREFAANVSHELKTPITAIKGFVETLRDGAIDDKAQALNFMQIISRHTDRLNAIIDDLLSLSRIEQNADHNRITREEVVLSEVIESAIGPLRIKAEEKKIDIGYVPDDDFRININASLIEQAVSNLIDNAINYSDPGKDIEVKIIKSDSEIEIAISDQGRGIERRHLPRLFERFYRADTARSRRLGGTGLGLAIVKHIAQAHNGYVTVKSEPGRGSEFSIFIPLI